MDTIVDAACPISEYVVIVSWSISQRRMTSLSSLFRQPYQLACPLLSIPGWETWPCHNNLHNITFGTTTKESLINKWRMKSLNISQNPDCYIIFVKVQMRKGKKLAKRCLLHWLRPPPTHTHTVQITFIFINFRVCDFAFAFKTQNAPCVSRFKRVLFSDRFQFAF